MPEAVHADAEGSETLLPGRLGHHLHVPAGTG